MDAKKSPGDWRDAQGQKKPLLNYSGQEKTVNPYLMQSEKITLVNAFAYGDFPQREFVSPKNSHLYSNLESYCNNFPIGQWSCESFIDYLKTTGAITQCGGVEYVRGIFQGIEGGADGDF